MGIRVGRTPPAGERHEFLELTCVVDGRAHLVAVDLFASTASAQRGVFPALCGHDVTAGSMSAPPGPACRSCGTTSNRGQDVIQRTG